LSLEYMGHSLISGAMKIVLSLLLVVALDYPVVCLHVYPGPNGGAMWECDGEVIKPPDCKPVDRRQQIWKCKGIPQGWREV